MEPRFARAHGSQPSLAAERSRLHPARLGPADRGPRADAGWAGDGHQAGGLGERGTVRQQPERAGADAGRGGRGGGGRRAVPVARRPQRRCVSADVNRTIIADALYQAGRRAEAEARFREAEQMQAERQPDYPLLYSVQGFRYCDLLLAEAERAAWRELLRRSAIAGRCDALERRYRPSPSARRRRSVG